MAAKTLTLDIETYCTRNLRIIERLTREALDARPANNAAKDDKILWDTDDARAERVREKLDKTAVSPLLAEILLVTLCLDGKRIEHFDCMTNHDDPQPGAREHDELTRLAEFMAANTDERTIWIGHNIAGFDLPIILNRWRHHKITPPAAFPVFVAGRWRGRVYDTMQRVPNGTPFVSLEAACESCGIELLGVEWQGQPMDGSRVGAAYEAGEFGLILQYCEGDVLATVALYGAMTAGGTWGTWLADNHDETLQRIKEIEENPIFTESQKAINQKTIMQRAGLWPI